MGINWQSFDRRIDESGIGTWFEAAKGMLLSNRAEPSVVRADRVDILLALVFACVAVAIAWHTQNALPLEIYDPANFDIWFQADQPRIIGALADRTSFEHHRDSVHPLFSMLAYPPAAVLRMLGFSTVAAALILVLSAAFLCTFLLYLTLRQFTLSRMASALGCCVFLSSATFLYWFAIAETYALTALTSVATTWLFLRFRDRELPALLGSCISLSMTVTNWTLGLALTAMRFRLSRVIRISVAALLICVTLSVVQSRIFPSANQFFRPGSVKSETRWTQTAIEERGEGQWTPLDNVRSVMVSAAIAPAPYTTALNAKGRAIVDNQRLSPASYDFIGMIGVASWAAALLLSLIGLIMDRKLTAPVIALLGFMAGQIVLHLFYGDITFLFAGNFFLILVMLASLGSITRLRVPHGTALLCFVVAGAVSNVGSFNHSVRMVTASVMTPTAR